jgi:hypothetical protein
MLNIIDITLISVEIIFYGNTVRPFSYATCLRIKTNVLQLKDKAVNQDEYSEENTL